VEAVPELAGHEYIFALNVTFSEFFLQSSTDFLLVSINPSFIDVPVSEIKGDLGSFIDLSGFRQPCSESELRNLITCAFE